MQTNIARGAHRLQYAVRAHGAFKRATPAFQRRKIRRKRSRRTRSTKTVISPSSVARRYALDDVPGDAVETLLKIQKYELDRGPADPSNPTVSAGELVEHLKERRHAKRELSETKEIVLGEVPCNE